MIRRMMESETKDANGRNEMETEQQAMKRSEG